MQNSMNTVEKRDYIHNYLYRIDDKHIDEMFNKVKELVENDIVLIQGQEEEIQKRVMRHKKGESIPPFVASSLNVF